MNRKPPKRAGESKQPPLTVQRIAELADIVVSDNHALGLQDVSDLVEALRELADRRHAERIIQSLTTDDVDACEKDLNCFQANGHEGECDAAG